MVYLKTVVKLSVQITLSLFKKIILDRDRLMSNAEGGLVPRSITGILKLIVYTDLAYLAPL